MSRFSIVPYITCTKKYAVPGVAHHAAVDSMTIVEASVEKAANHSKGAEWMPSESRRVCLVVSKHGPIQHHDTRLYTFIRHVLRVSYFIYE